MQDELKEGRKKAVVHHVGWLQLRLLSTSNLKRTKGTPRRLPQAFLVRPPIVPWIKIIYFNYKRSVWSLSWDSFIKFLGDILLLHEVQILSEVEAVCEPAKMTSLSKEVPKAELIMAKELWALRNPIIEQERAL
eukprot:1161058-Pelagomonas_calceolata.AAC.5